MDGTGEQRVERVERQVRRLQRLVAVIGVVLAVALTLGFTPDREVLTVRGFVVVDDEGRVRVATTTTPDGETAVALSDGDGVVRIRLGTGSAPPFLASNCLTPRERFGLWRQHRPTPLWSRC